MFTALLLGISYGFTAGITPGALLGLVITQSLQRGWRAGNLVALAPLISDLPIILLAILVLSHLPASILDWLAIIGGLFVIYLGIETILTARKIVHQTTGEGRDDEPFVGINMQSEEPAMKKGDASTVLWRAVLTNFLNPHPYLFWTTVGVQLLLRITQSSGVSSAAVFLISFYVLLVGSKLVLALIVSRSRRWLKGRTYQGILIASGILLIGLGLLLAYQGIHAL